MFLEALLVMAKTGNNPKCSSIDEWISKLWYIHTMEHYSAIKRNKLLIHETTWTNLKLSERRETRRSHYSTHSCKIIKIQTGHNDRKQISNCLGRDRKEGLPKGHRNFWRNWMCSLDCGDGFLEVYIQVLMSYHMLQICAIYYMLVMSLKRCLIKNFCLE